MGADEALISFWIICSNFCDAARACGSGSGRCRWFIVNFCKNKTAIRVIDEEKVRRVSITLLYAERLSPCILYETGGQVAAYGGGIYASVCYFLV